MLILGTIFLFIFIPLVMLILRLARPRFNIQGFLAVLAGLVGWILVLLARPDAPAIVSLPHWEPDSLFAISPSLLVDDTSWYFALALTTLALSVVLTSIAKFGQSSVNAVEQSQNKPIDDEGTVLLEDAAPSVQATAIPGTQPPTGWTLWASILFLTSLGLLAVTAGNLLTLLLAWTALDLIELVILLSQMVQSRTRERIILAFSARIAGTCLVLLAGVLTGLHGAALSFEAFSWPISSLLIIAAGLRLGVLPLHLPYTKGLPINRNLGTVLRLIPAMASFILLVRASTIGISGIARPYLLAFTVLAGTYAAVNWLRAKDELDGRPYWLIATSSLALVSAILSLPVACLSWSIASVLSGGLIFSMSLRHKKLVPLVILGILNLSSLPFSSTWQGAGLFQFSSLIGLSLPLYALFFFFFLLIQAFIVAGFTRHAMQAFSPETQIPSFHVERWVWLLYPFSLIFLVLIHLFIGWQIYPNIRELPVSAWIMGPAILIVTGLILFFAWRHPYLYHPSLDKNIRSTWDRLFSLDWVYRFFWKLFRSFTRASALVSEVLEGDGGLLWALVLFGLIFVFLQR